VTYTDAPGKKEARSLIDIEGFFGALLSFQRFPPNPEQKKAIEAPPRQPLFLVAGPGTGKTACLVLRILKLLFVDGVPPSGILATTFTKKAAAELRSRILDWGFRLQEVLLGGGLTAAQREFFRKLDVNQVKTGTLDSLCESLLRDYREPGTDLPVMADEFISGTLMLREGLLDGQRYTDADLDALLLYLNGNNRFGFFVGKKAHLLMSLWERRFHDQADWQQYVNDPSAPNPAGRRVADQALEKYRQTLESQGLLDFVQLEQKVLERLKNRQLSDFTQALQVVLVDEYQDSNYLQEQIYFEMANACGGALTVVGDDDQSLYRFRGATVELFSDFEKRFKKRFGVSPTKIFLSENYRFTPEILDFVNNYATLDDSFQSVRVAGKPVLSAGLPFPEEECPEVLGMFRDDVETLAQDLADFIFQVFRKGGYRLPSGVVISGNGDGGDVGDCTLLCSSPQETVKGKGKTPSLPLALRKVLRTYGVEVFNPRGEDFAGIEIVQVMGGLLLECFDPGGGIQQTLSGVTDEVQKCLDTWRQQSLLFLSSQQTPQGLQNYAAHWASRSPGKSGQRWPVEISALELLYGLWHYFPEVHDDPEGQLFFEVFTRQFSAAEQVGKFTGKLIQNPQKPALNQASIKELIRNWLVPIAAGTVKVNEEMIESFPRNRVSVLSIHQAKGLEFPMVIVDVGSAFRRNHQAQAFRRFPRGGQETHILEDELRRYSPLQVSARNQADRAFDDLYRQYFVAFSRPQQVLLLAGLGTCHPDSSFVQNVAAGWKRGGTSSEWQGKHLFHDI